MAKQSFGVGSCMGQKQISRLIVCTMEIPRHWRLKAERYNLVGEVCEKGHHVFPPRDICPDCHGEAKIPFQFSGKGTVYSATIVYDAPTGFEGQAPYQVALIKLDEGPMLTAMMTDLDNPTELVRIGAEVEMSTRKLSEDGEAGLINYGYKFRIPIKNS